MRIFQVVIFIHITFTIINRRSQSVHCYRMTFKQYVEMDVELGMVLCTLLRRGRDWRKNCLRVWKEFGSLFKLHIHHTYRHRYRQGHGSGGGGGKGAIVPPQFLSQWDGWICLCPPPLNVGNHQAYVQFCPPPRKKSSASVDIDTERD